MQILHDSLKRTLEGATLCGSVTGLREDDSPSGREFACLVEAVRKHSWAHRWDVDVVMTPGGNGQRYSIPVRVDWAGSVPVISASHVDLPLGLDLSFRMMIHNAMFAGTWHDGDRAGQVYGKIEPKKPLHPRNRYTIERSSECMHDWWTGTDWSDNPADAKWFQHEPCGPAETQDEGAHTIFHRHGKVEAG